jgi:hypothetical protein
MAHDRTVKPNFFIVGAPECATAALATYLGRHPEIGLVRKEVPSSVPTSIPPTSADPPGPPGCCPSPVSSARAPSDLGLERAE